MTITSDRKETEIGMIPQEWEISCIGEYGKVLGGFAFKSDDFGDEGYPVVKIKNINNSNVDLIDTDKILPQIVDERIEKYELKDGDFVVAMTGATIGKVGKVKTLGDRVFLNQRVGKFEITNKNKLLKDFLYYTTQLNGFVTSINNIANGVAQANISTTQIEGINIPLPPLLEQEAIATILGSLDDKIELLKEQNKTLEAMGQAMFKSWFVDFEGQEFMVESEIGMIPKGWRVGKLGEVIKLLGGFPFKTESYNNDGEYKLVTIGNVNDGYFDPNCNNNILELPEKFPDYCKLHPGDILLSLTGNVGRVCMTFGENFVLNQRVAKIIPNGGDHFAYCYFLMRQKSMQDLMISISRGTAQMNLSPIETQELNIVIPNKDDLIKMEKQLIPQFQKILENVELIESLVGARNSLLPRLMNGKIRLI